MHTFKSSLTYYVPLREIFLARAPHDVLGEYQRTGKAFGFTPGELRSIAETSDAEYTGYLRAPKKREIPRD